MLRRHRGSTPDCLRNSKGLGLEGSQCVVEEWVSVIPALFCITELGIHFCPQIVLGILHCALQHGMWLSLFVHVCLIVNRARTILYSFLCAQSLSLYLAGAWTFAEWMNQRLSYAEVTWSSFWVPTVSIAFFHQLALLAPHIDLSPALATSFLEPWIMNFPVLISSHDPPLLPGCLCVAVISVACVGGAIDGLFILGLWEGSHLEG